MLTRAKRLTRCSRVNTIGAVAMNRSNEPCSGATRSHVEGSLREIHEVAGRRRLAKQILMAQYKS